MKSLSTLGGGGPAKAGRGCVRSQDSMADSSPTTYPILILLPGRHWARCQQNDGKMVPLWCISIHGLRHAFESGLWSITILNPMADSSTTAEPILIPSLARHWAQRQVHGLRERVLRCQFSMGLDGPGEGKRAVGRGGK